MARGKKITKKKLKEPDEFITVNQRIFIYVQKHVKKIATAAAIVVAVVVLVILYQAWQSSKESDADQKLAAAMEIYQKVSSPYQETPAAETKNALAKLDEVIKAYPGTSAGRLSLLYKGNVHLKMGEFDEALKAYQAALDRAGKEKLYRIFALEGLGYGYEGKKDWAKAVEAYRKIVDLGESFQTGEGYLGLGRCYENLGKNREALESYQAYLKVTKDSDKTYAVLRKISLLEKKE